MSSCGTWSPATCSAGPSRMASERERTNGPIAAPVVKCMETITKGMIADARPTPMTPALASPLFVASIALMLLASAWFARRLDEVGLRVGLPEALLGLLTAPAADAPEISSAISALVQHQHSVAVGVVVGSNAFNLAAMLGLSAVVAGRVRARHETLELEGFVGLWLLAVLLAVVAGGLGSIAAAVLVAVVGGAY